MATVEVRRIGGEEAILRGSEGVVAMPMSEGKKKRGIVQNTLRLAICSELRRGILISLREGKKALSELRTALEISSTTAIHALRELEKDNLVFQDEHRDYALTKIGEIIALKLSDFIDAIKVLKKHEDFWLTHDISGIPSYLLEKIGWLKNLTLAEDTSTDIFKVHLNFINLLKNAKEIKGVSSIFVPDYPLLFVDLVIKKKADVQLVMTEEVFNKMLEMTNQKLLKMAIKDENFKLKLYTVEENINAAFTVTDYFLSFGLFHVDGTYDYNRDIISYDREGIKWGRELFEWYLKRAERVYL